MKYLILALLAATFSAFVATAEAGTTIKCGSGDPMKNLNLHKSGSGGKGGPLCADGGSERVLSQQGRVEDDGIKNSGHASERTTIKSTKSNASFRNGNIIEYKDDEAGFNERDKLKGSTKSVEGGKNDGSQDQRGKGKLPGFERGVTVKGSKSNGSY